MATIRDVAKRANVAICTVSRVLNGNGYVADETRKRIETAMSEINYVPNQLARGMFLKKSGIVAMLVPGIKHLYFSTLADHIERELHSHGYRLMLCATGGDLAREREQMQFLRSNMVDGVISGVGNLGEYEYRDFKKPLVMLDHKLPDIPFVVSDYEKSGLQLAELFIERKNKCVAQLIYEHQGRRSLSLTRHDVFGTVLQEAGIQCVPITLDWDKFDYYSYLEMARTMLLDQPEIDGVMAADIPAAAFLKEALKIGKKVPEDFRVAACDGTYIISSNMMEITSVVQNLAEIAKQSVNLLVRMIDGEKPAQMKNLIAISVNYGETI